MRRTTLLVAGLAAMAAASGCAAAISVSSHVDRSADFARYRTFDWGPADALPTGDPRLDRDLFFRDHVQGAVEHGLASRGLALVEAGTPDLLIHFHANVSERIDVNQTERAYDDCAAGDCQTTIVSYEAGTLVLDFMDAHTNTLVWRGWAQNGVADMLGNRDTMARTIDEAVARMLRRLPPTR